MVLWGYVKIKNKVFTPFFVQKAENTLFLYGELFIKVWQVLFKILLAAQWWLVLGQPLIIATG